MMIKWTKAIISLGSLLYLTTYPFFYDTKQSLVNNLGYYKLDSKDNIDLGDDQLDQKSNYLNTAVHLIKRQRQSLLQQRNAILSLKEEIQHRENVINNLNSNLRETTTKVEDILFALDLAGNKGAPLSERLRNVELEVLNQLIINRLLPVSKVLKKGRITSKFGYRIHPITKKKKHHNGIDFGVPSGTPIYAPADGIVTSTKTADETNGSGNFIKLEHGMGFKTSYSHLSKILVSNQSVVSKGDIIGLTGNTGRSTGPHLHYEVSFLNKKIDPLPLVQYAQHKSIERLMEYSNIPWNDLQQNINELTIKTALVLK
ncbi:M23 family metallopeptidase [Photobacterium angustum]|uniref:M23 family peptidase n=1 Tax=Photobacterium angustum TaxID=661 RepID=A0ABX5GYH6_PHOAN|nr:M23 family metallopeptidase [Photobacterium angustum]PSX03954.1 M23 family peptidase [Photobacterium angustum]